MIQHVQMMTPGLMEGIFSIQLLMRQGEAAYLVLIEFEIFQLTIHF